MRGTDLLALFRRWPAAIGGNRRHGVTLAELHCRI